MIKTDNETVEKIAQLIENLPSDSFLSFDLTEDQKQYWDELRDSNALVAKAWRTLFSSKASLQASKFEQYCEVQGIAPMKTKAAFQVAKSYKLLWEVVILGEKYTYQVHSALPMFLSNFNQDQSEESKFLQKIFSGLAKEKYRFQSDQDLFEQIVIEDTDLVFMECLTDYSVASIPKSKKVLKTVEKLCINYNPRYLNLIESKLELKNFLHYISVQKIKYSWKELLLFSCAVFIIAESSTKNQLLSDKLTEYYNTTSELITLSFTAFRKRKSQNGKKPNSYQWINGERLSGCEEGGTYRKP